MYRKHYWDLEQLVFGQFQSDKSRTAWKDYLTGIKGAAPSDMPNPHAHHILFKKGLGEAQQMLVHEGQDLLRKVGIDPLFGKEVFVWAPLYAKGQHSPDTADDLVRDLKALWDSGSRSKQKFADILKKHGEIAAGRR